LWNSIEACRTARLSRSTKSSTVRSGHAWQPRMRQPPVDGAHSFVFYGRSRRRTKAGSFRTLTYRAYPANNHAIRRQFQRGSVARRPLREFFLQSGRTAPRRSVCTTFSGTPSIMQPERKASSCPTSLRTSTECPPGKHPGRRREHRPHDHTPMVCGRRFQGCYDIGAPLCVRRVEG
jgi:hypothetical protein